MERMTQEVFSTIWYSLSEERQRKLMLNVNNTSQHLYEKHKSELDKNFAWYLNCAFDKEEPLQYVYLEGAILVNPQNIRDMNGVPLKALIAPNYIHVSSNPDDFLDRMSESKNNDSIIERFGNL